MRIELGPEQTVGRRGSQRVEAAMAYELHTLL